MVWRVFAKMIRQSEVQRVSYDRSGKGFPDSFVALEIGSDPN